MTMEQNNKKKILVVGAGIAGLEAASQLQMLGYEVNVLEKKEQVGGHVKKWFKTFPYFDDSSKIIDAVESKNEDIHLLTDTLLTYAEPSGNGFKVNTSRNKQFYADAILLTNGFHVFDAHKKEEYGYGIFENVISNEDLEKFFVNGFPKSFEKSPRFGFIHCVGSRDAKAGNLYCSKVCCATAVKQAIEVKEHFPGAEVYCFYMDLRMFGKNYEELFQTAQEKFGIHFVRARLSEVNQNFDKTLLIKVEDTLTSRPMKLTLDCIVLMSGMEPSRTAMSIANLLGVETDENGFYKPRTHILEENQSSVKGVFIAGAASGPKTIVETMHDARSAALNIHNYLSQQQ